MRRDFWLPVAMSLMLAGCGAQGTRPPRDNSPAAEVQTERTKAADTNTQLGQGYLEQGKLDIAMEKLKRALELNPRSATAHTVIAVLYERIGDIANAQYHYDRATQLDTRSGSLANNYGTFLCHQGKYDEADKYFARALADPFYATPAVALANRGSCAASAGNLEVAEDAYTQATKLTPNDPEALLGMAQVKYLRADYLRARAFLQRYESTGQNLPGALLLGYQIEQQLKNVKGSNDYKNRLLSDFPDSPEARGLDGGN